MSATHLGTASAARRPLFLPPQISATEELPCGQEIPFGGQIFGTTWMVRLIAAEQQGPLALATLRKAMEEQAKAVLDVVDRQMSPWIGESHINRYNGLPAGSTAALPEPMRTLVSHALALRQETDGAFDPFLGEATDLWGFGPVPFDQRMTYEDRRRAMARRTIHAAPALVGKNLMRCGGHQLDLCGIAKGFAVDLVAQSMLADQRIAAVLVEIGGELQGHGVKPDGMPWWVDLAWDSYGAAPQMRLALYGWACASSGVDERSLRGEDRRYSHAIDPQTGEPTHSDLRGVTVLDRQCWRADALATALLVVGMARASEMAERLQIPCVLIPADPSRAGPRFSAAMQDWQVCD